MRFLSGFTIALLAFSGPPLAPAAALVIALITFWRPLLHLHNGAALDLLALRLLQTHRHHGDVDGNARIAWRAKELRRSRGKK